MNRKKIKQFLKTYFSGERIIWMTLVLLAILITGYQYYTAAERISADTLNTQCAFSKDFAAEYLVNCSSVKIGVGGVTICKQVPPGVVNPEDIPFMDIPRSETEDE